MVTFVVMPQLFDTVLSLQYSLPVFFNDVKQGAEKLFAQYPEISDSINNIQIDWKSYLEKIVQFYMLVPEQCCPLLYPQL